MTAAIDAAIAATEQPPEEPRAEFQARLPSGRVVAINVPVNLDANEAIALIGYIAIQLPAELAKMRGRPSPILVPQRGIARV